MANNCNNFNFLPLKQFIHTSRLARARTQLKISNYHFSWQTFARWWSSFEWMPLSRTILMLQKSVVDLMKWNEQTLVDFPRKARAKCIRKFPNFSSIISFWFQKIIFSFTSAWTLLKTSSSSTSPTDICVKRVRVSKIYVAADDAAAELRLL